MGATPSRATRDSGEGSEVNDIVFNFASFRYTFHGAVFFVEAGGEL